MVFNFLSTLSDPAVLLSREGEVQFANDAVRDLADLKVGDSIASYLTEHSFDELMNQGITEAAADKVWRKSVQVTGSQCHPQHTEVSCSAVRLADQPEFFALVFNDQSARLPKAAAPLKIDEQLPDHKVRRRDRAISGEIELDSNGRICNVNDVMLDMSGKSLDQLLQQRFWSLSCWPDRVDLELSARRCLDAAFCGEPERMPARLMRTSGHVAWMELSFTPRHHADGGIERVLVEATDVTTRVVSEIGRRQYTERLVSLSRQLLRAQETERRKISMELHDDIGQSLTALRLSLYTVQNSLVDDKQFRRLDHCMTMVDQVLNKIRDMSLLLRPPMLDDLGLIAALQWFSHNQTQLTGLDIRLETDLDGLRWSPAQEGAIYRIVQEAVSNAMRHSDATVVTISLTLVKGRLDVRVQDNGKGFPADDALEQAGEGSSLGLLGMQQRAALVNGEILLESTSATGTCVIALIPV